MNPRKVALLALLVISAPLTARAQYEHLENPGTVSAVQERLYRLNHELTLGVGALPLDAFYKGVAAQLGYTHHFSDSFAWQVGRGSYSLALDTGLRAQLERDFGVQPTEFPEVEWLAGSDLVFSPVYGKLAVMNSRVVHFAAHLSAGATVFKLNRSGQGQLRPAAAVGVGLRVFQNQWVSFRFDAVDHVVFSDTIFHVPTFFLSTALNFGATE